MTAFQPLLVAAACSLALAACVSAPPAHQTGALPAANTTGFARSAATGGSYPYGTVPKVGAGVPQPAATAVGVEVVVLGPDGTVWIQSGVDGARQKDDLDTCYFDAQGQVGFTSYTNRAPWATFLNVAGRRETGGLRLAALDGRMNDFDSCMVGKGYSPK